jgi:hypothetical protein
MTVYLSVYLEEAARELVVGQRRLPSDGSPPDTVLWRLRFPPAK